MGELGNTADQATPGTNPPIHLPPAPDLRGASGGAKTPGGAQVPDSGSASSAPDSPPPKKTVFPMPYIPPQGAGGAQVPEAGAACPGG